MKFTLKLIVSSNMLIQKVSIDGADIIITEK